MRIELPNGSVTLRQGDLTQEDADAIVNAANAALLPGGGVCGAIHRAGGPQIAEECAAIVRRHGELPAGKAVATSGGKLRARHVIHSVGPVWQGGRENEPETLASCYRESIRLADSLGLKNIAFPSISTGIFGYPVELAAPVAARAVAEAVAEAKHTHDVRFVLFDAETYHAYVRAVSALTKTA